MTKRFCNVCGCEFDEWDEQEDFSLERRIGYGSTHDGEVIRLDMCCRCFDEFVDTYLIPRCSISPLETEGS